MPSQADKLMQENMSKNLIDQDEYPMTREYGFRGFLRITDPVVLRNSSYAMYDFQRPLIT